ncbi:MAG TPA: ABC transporter permease [Anaerolineaceae bacterium]
MLQYITRRLLLLFPVVAGILVIVFIIVRLIPGDPCYVMLGEKATEEQCEQFNVRYGLNDNVVVQLVRYIGNIFTGDFGTSIRDKRPIGEIVAERLPMTMELAIAAVLFSSTLGIFLGVIAALNRNSIVDVLTMLGANIGVSMPVFWLGLLLAYFFALVLKDTPFYIPPSYRLSSGVILPRLDEVWKLGELKGIPAFVIAFLSNSAIINSIVTGNFATLKDALWHLILPALAVGTISMAVVARMTRSSLLDTLGQDYIRTARAKGLVERLVIFRHALRNALIPIITVIGLQFGGLLSGAVLTETIFSLPGMGSKMVEAILNRDYPVVQGFTVVIAVIYVLTNLVVDISYAYLDPRIRVD